MARAKKDTRTELQKAADRVAEMEVAVANTERDLEVCTQAYEEATRVVEEAHRNLQDTTDLLTARKSKLKRERMQASNLALPNIEDVFN